ncbi:MAG TPA: sporulation protein YabP [Firmicutes bacterium]|jgi:sporulation protein YabP|nr:sporulation protein YabP [Bacillota bacterium]
MNSHQLTLVKREKLTIDGVTNVGSYDPTELLLETEDGVLMIKGENLHLTQLNLEQGKIGLTGMINSLNYSNESLTQKSRGLFGKIFK